MKVIFVMSCSYPSSGTGTNITNKLIFDGFLQNSVDEIAVVCGKESIDENDYDNYDGISVFRANSFTLIPKNELNKLRKRSFTKYLRAIIEKSLFHIVNYFTHNSIDDRFAVRAFYQKLCGINAATYDVIISMSGRYYPSIATANYCKDNKIPFIFYQVDPCASSQFLPPKSLKKRIRVEKEIYDAADYVITTDLIHKDVVEYMPKNLTEKIFEMEFPLISDRKYTSESSHNKKTAKCVFSGSIYGGIRDPQYTINLFRKLYKDGIAELHFAGTDSKDLHDAEYVNCHGILSLDEAMSLNATADFLVNIGNSVTNQVPSKLFDYISTGKPIINICKNHNCPTIKYLDKYPIAINLYEDAKDFDRQVEMLKTFIMANKGKTVRFSKIYALYRECTPEFCAEKILALINSLEKK